VSKATKRHCAGTVQSQGGRVRNVKQVGFEPGPEYSDGRCGSDKLRQTVLFQTRAAATMCGTTYQLNHIWKWLKTFL